MSRIEERLRAIQVDASEMTTEEKFTAATGLTHYDEDIAANDWYVPGGAANVVEEPEVGPQGPQGTNVPEQGEQGEQGTDEPEQGEQGEQGTDVPEQGEQGEQGTDEPEQGEQTTPSEIEVETQEP